MTKQNTSSHSTPTVLTGVFMSVYNVGVLIMGQPKSGKSTLALHLLRMGHRLIADDTPLFEQHQNTLVGRSPTVLQDALCVYPIGVLNIRKLWGDAALLSQATLECIVTIDAPKPKQSISDLHPMIIDQVYLGISLPTLYLTGCDQAHWPLLVETNILNFKLKQDGFDSVTHFCNNQQQCMELDS